MVTFEEAKIIRYRFLKDVYKIQGASEKEIDMSEEAILAFQKYLNGPRSLVASAD